jgi:hypothetical protein
VKLFTAEVEDDCSYSSSHSVWVGVKRDEQVFWLSDGCEGRCQMG